MDSTHGGSQYGALPPLPEHTHDTQPLQPGTNGQPYGALPHAASYEMLSQGEDGSAPALAGAPSMSGCSFGVSRPGDPSIGNAATTRLASKGNMQRPTLRQIALAVKSTGSVSRALQRSGSVASGGDLNSPSNPSLATASTQSAQLPASSSSPRHSRQSPAAAATAKALTTQSLGVGATNGVQRTSPPLTATASGPSATAQRSSRGMPRTSSGSQPIDQMASIPEPAAVALAVHVSPGQQQAGSVRSVGAQRSLATESFNTALHNALSADSVKISPEVADQATDRATPSPAPAPLPLPGQSSLSLSQNQVDGLAYAHVHSQVPLLHANPVYTSPGGDDPSVKPHHHGHYGDHHEIVYSPTKAHQMEKGVPDKAVDRYGKRWSARWFAMLPYRILKKLIYDVWSPTEPIRLAWDLIMLSLLLYVVYITPYIVAFGISSATFDNPIAFIDITVNALFMLDVVFNFRTAFSDVDGKLVYDRKAIFVNYITGWFWLDAATSMPWDNMFGNQYGVLKVLRLLRIIRLVKVFRVFRMMRLSKVIWARNFMAFVDKIVENLFTRMLLFGLVAFSFVHWAACMFYYVASLYGPDRLTWITNIEGQDSPVLDAESPNVDWYVFSLYWAITTMSTVGYGDITGIQIGEKVVAMVAMVLGASIFAYFMASMATLVAAMNNTNVRVTRKKALVQDFLHTRKIPGRLGTKVRNYFEYVLDRQLHSDEAQLIAELPSSLRRQIMWHLHREALEKVPFFQGKDSFFLTALVPYLKLEYYSPGDIIVRQEETGHEMFFIAEGTVEARMYQDQVEDGPSRAETSDLAHVSKAHAVFQKIMGHNQSKVKLLDEDLVSNPYTVVCQLNAGQYFGEYTCFFGEPRVATVVSITFCELYSLSSHDVEQVQEDWPDLEADLSLLLNNNPMTWEAQAYEARKQLTRVPSTTFKFEQPSYVYNEDGYEPSYTAGGTTRMEAPEGSTAPPTRDPTVHSAVNMAPAQSAARAPPPPPPAAAALPSLATQSADAVAAGSEAAAAAAAASAAEARRKARQHHGDAPGTTAEMAQIIQQLQAVQAALQHLLPPDSHAGHHALGRSSGAEADHWPLLRHNVGAPTHPLASAAVTPLNMPTNDAWPLIANASGRAGTKPSGRGPGADMLTTSGSARHAMGTAADFSRYREGESIRRGRVNAPAAVAGGAAAVASPKAAAAAGAGMRTSIERVHDAPARPAAAAAEPPHTVIAVAPHPDAKKALAAEPRAPSPSPLASHVPRSVAPSRAAASPKRDLSPAAQLFTRRSGLPSTYDPGANEGNPFATQGARHGGRNTSVGSPRHTAQVIKLDDPDDADTSGGGGDALVSALAKKLPASSAPTSGPKP